MLPPRNLLFEQDNARAGHPLLSNLFPQKLRFVVIKKQRFEWAILKNISVLSSAAYTSRKNWNTSRALYSCIEFGKYSSLMKTYFSLGYAHYTLQA